MTTTLTKQQLQRTKLDNRLWKHDAYMYPQGLMSNNIRHTWK